MSKCPVCGYDTNRNYNYSKDILKMLTAMNSQTLKYVKRLVKDVQGKGFAYIKAMILNENKNVAKKAANEYKRLGRVPKIIKLKGDEINEKRSRTTKNKKSK